MALVAAGATVYAYNSMLSGTVCGAGQSSIMPYATAAHYIHFTGWRVPEVSGPRYVSNVPPYLTWLSASCSGDKSGSGSESLFPNKQLMIHGGGFPNYNASTWVIRNPNLTEADGSNCKLSLASKRIHATKNKKDKSSLLLLIGAAENLPVLTELALDLSNHRPVNTTGQRTKPDRG